MKKVYKKNLIKMLNRGLLKILVTIIFAFFVTYLISKEMGKDELINSLISSAGIVLIMIFFYRKQRVIIDSEQITVKGWSSVAFKWNEIKRAIWNKKKHRLELHWDNHFSMKLNDFDAYSDFETLLQQLRVYLQNKLELIN